MNKVLLEKLRKIIKNVSCNSLKCVYQHQLEEWLEIDSDECSKFIRELVEENLIEEKYDFQCECGNDCTVYHRLLLTEDFQCSECERKYNKDDIKSKAEVLYENMKSEGFLVEQIHGDISQERRFYIIDSFKKHEFNILISSDIISRGIHIDDVSLVINYDIPSDSEIYVHRIGRTGRAGKHGKAISLVSNNECRDFENIEVYTKNKIEPIGIEYCEKDKIEYQKTIKELLNKYALVENQEQDEFKGEVVKIHISIGKKKKIRIGDIVGALSNIDSLENSDLGVIKIYDNYSTVDILNQKGKKFLNDYKEIIVKNKKAKIREEK